MRKEEIQESEYAFPYHYIPYYIGDKFKIVRILDWGVLYFVYMEYIIGVINKFKPKKILDIGCGDGRLLNYFDEIVKDKPELMKGIDISEKAIKFAQAFSHNVVFESMDIADEKEGYECVIMMEVLEHIPTEVIPEFLKNVWDKITVGGKMIITVPSIFIPVDSKHYRHYSIESLLETFENLGVSFNLIKSTYLIKCDSFLVRVLRKIGNNRIWFLRPHEKYIKKIYEKNVEVSKNGMKVVVVLEKC